MKYKTRKSIIIASIFMWLGFICAISFMEAWLKFSAPGVTLSIGLGIGRIVFGALNKVEWFLGVIVVLSVLLNRDRLFAFENACLFIVIIILGLQTSWLLPALDRRAALYIEGQFVPASGMHIYFVIGEIIKVFCLFIAGIAYLKGLSNDKRIEIIRDA